MGRGMGRGRLGFYERVEEEIARGRLWRAKEIVQGRLRDARYDAGMFRRYGEVLAAMHDEDEAGRYFLLAGVTEGEAGRLARAFLARRARTDIAPLWGAMPTAARRLAALSFPDGTRALLVEAGFEARAIDEQARKLAVSATSAKRSSRRTRSRSQLPPTRGATVVSWVVFVVLCIVMALGLLRTIDIAINFARRIF